MKMENVQIADKEPHFTKEYYTLRAVFSSDKYRRGEKDVLNELDKLGCSVPKKGFETVKEYHRWQTKLPDKNVSLYSMINGLLESFSLDPESDFYRVAFISRIFFKERIPRETPVLVTWNEDKGKPEIRIHIYPHTKKKHLEKIWPFIERRQKLLFSSKKCKDKYGVRNREWECFERDLRLYNLYLKVEKKIKEGHLKERDYFGEGVTTPSHESISKSVYKQMRAYGEFKSIRDEFGEVNEEMLHKVIRKCKGVFGNVKLMD